MLKGEKIPLKRQSMLSARLRANFKYNLAVSCKVLGHQIHLTPGIFVLNNMVSG